MSIIEKKCWPEFFNMFCSGERQFELRLADFNLKTGDTLLFREYEPGRRGYTGRTASFNCERVEHSATNPLQFYDVERIKEHGFWIIKLKKSD